MEALGQGFRELVEIGSPQEDQQGKLPWTIGSSQGLTTKQEVYRRQTTTYGTYVANVQLSLHMGPQHVQQGLSL